MLVGIPNSGFFWPLDWLGKCLIWLAIAIMNHKDWHFQVSDFDTRVLFKI